MVDSDPIIEFLMGEIEKTDINKIEKLKLINILILILDYTPQILKYDGENTQTRDKVLGLIAKSTDISDYFNALIKSEENKLSLGETLALTPVKILSSQLNKLIKRKDSVFEEKKEITRIVSKLRNHLLDINMDFLGLHDYEKR